MGGPPQKFLRACRGPLPPRAVHRCHDLLRGAQLPRAQADPQRVQPVLQELVPSQPVQTPDRGAEGCALQVHEAPAHLHVPRRGRCASGGPSRPSQSGQELTGQPHFLNQ